LDGVVFLADDEVNQQERATCNNMQGEQGPAFGDLALVENDPFWEVSSANADGSYDLLQALPPCKVLRCVPRTDVEVYVQASKKRMEALMTDARRKLPEWALHSDSDGVPFLGLNVGPVIPYMRGVVMGLIVTQISMFALSRATTSCSQDGDAEYPVGIVSFMLPLFFVRLLVEWRALKRALLRIAGLASFRILGKEVYFSVWFVFVFIGSQLAYADICTDCLFTSSSLKNLQCDPAIKSILHDTGMVPSWAGFRPRHRRERSLECGFCP